MKLLKAMWAGQFPSLSSDLLSTYSTPFFCPLPTRLFLWTKCIRRIPCSLASFWLCLMGDSWKKWEEGRRATLGCIYHLPFRIAANWLSPQHISCQVFLPQGFISSLQIIASFHPSDMAGGGGGHPLLPLFIIANPRNVISSWFPLTPL